MDDKKSKIGSLVGKPDILSHKDVADAPSRTVNNRPIPVPSVYRDDRGEIHNLQVGRSRINLLSTKAGVLRSGDLHADIQHDFVFSGQLKVWTLEKDGTTTKTLYGPNQYIAIPPYVPHVFEFLEDTVIAEWWDRPFHSWFYQPYRQLVKESFHASRPGHFSHYVVTPDMEPFDGSIIAFKGWWTGLVLGLTLGYMLGRRR